MWKGDREGLERESEKRRGTMGRGEGKYETKLENERESETQAKASEGRQYVKRERETKMREKSERISWNEKKNRRRIKREST